jgi:hypothetical protein
MIRFTRTLLMVIFLTICFGCEDEEEIAATIEFKTGIGYTSQDAVITKGSSLTVGVVVTSAENKLKSYNVSVSYDGATITKTVKNFIITDTENSVYDKDVDFNVRDQKGNEKYYFTIVDADGNLVQKNLTFTVE